MEHLGSTHKYEKRTTPGNDDLMKEFYVCFFGELGSLLLKSLNYSPFGRRTVNISKTSCNYIDQKER